MDFLIDIEQDVEELRASRVLQNRLNNDAAQKIVYKTIVKESARPGWLKSIRNISEAIVQTWYAVNPKEIRTIKSGYGPNGFCCTRRRCVEPELEKGFVVPYVDLAGIIPSAIFIVPHNPLLAEKNTLLCQGSKQS
ncbi:hypothetical protein TorRG33x02_210430 [Trema orientale]|uniref:Uncharacterized protein n=1 Tax=Trema orientale TaxID=63057 RepID=A0A2P5ECD5_TREOI|nr:hypothetical protein TorRG33x02_210430 [Trema orientale]